MGIWTPSNTWFPGASGVLNPNGISIGSAVFAGLTSVTDWPTDTPCYSVGNKRPRVRTQYCDAAWKSKCGKPSKQINNNVAPNWTKWINGALHHREIFVETYTPKIKTPIKSKPLKQMQSNWEFKLDIEIPRNPDDFIRITQGIHPCRAGIYVPKFTLTLFGCHTQPCACQVLHTNQNGHS